MRIAIIISPHAEHQVATAFALKLGLAVHGDSVEIFHAPAEIPDKSGAFDAICTWGWRRGSRYFDKGKNVLVMERAYIGDRFHWVSLGWNGLNGRAKFCSQDDPSRWERYFGGVMQPAKPPATPGKGGYALLLGQVPTDTACREVDLQAWLTSTAMQLKNLGWDVRFRPHPKALGVQSGAKAFRGTSLLDDLSGAAVAVTFNSNSGVDAALAGVPVIAWDRGSMAWDVAAHSLDQVFELPDRMPWAHRLAWRQWQPTEIADGTAWAHVREALHG